MNLQQFINVHWAAITAGFVYFGTCFVATMPAKGVQWTSEMWYDWFYDFLHMAINQKSARIPAIPPTPEPAQPKEQA